MLYKIENKYYLRVSQYYLEVKFEISNNEVTTIPTNNRIEYSNGIVAEPIDIKTFKKSLLEKNSKKEEKVEVEEEKVEKKNEFKKFNKYSK